MKLVQIRKSTGIGLGILTDCGVIDVAEESLRRHLQAPNSMMEVIEGGERAISVLKGLEQDASCFSEDPLAPVISNPGKVLCIGLNYGKHAKECNLPLPKHPALFNKFQNAIAGDNDAVCLPAGYREYDYEAELVVVMGRAARNVGREQALDYVFGYTCGNDLSTRDLQFERSGQWVLSKTFDGFAPIGPCVVTADSIDAGNLHIWSKVNGETRQDSNTSDLIFSVAEIIEDLSAHFTLMPGDVIFTGTPEGVVYGGSKWDWLKPGNCVEVGIDGIGVLRNRMKGE